MAVCLRVNTMVPTYKSRKFGSAYTQTTHPHHSNTLMERDFNMNTKQSPRQSGPHPSFTYYFVYVALATVDKIECGTRSAFQEVDMQPQRQIYSAGLKTLWVLKLQMYPFINVMHLRVKTGQLSYSPLLTATHSSDGDWLPKDKILLNCDIKHLFVLLCFIFFWIISNNCLIGPIRLWVRWWSERLACQESTPAWPRMRMASAAWRSLFTCMVSGSQ